MKAFFFFFRTSSEIVTELRPERQFFPPSLKRLGDPIVSLERKKDAISGRRRQMKKERGRLDRTSKYFFSSHLLLFADNVCGGGGSMVTDERREIFFFRGKKWEAEKKRH